MKMQKKQLENKYPVLKRRSLKSREKVADSAMALSIKFWTVLVVSIVSIPLTSVLSSIVHSQPSMVSFETMKLNVRANLSLLIFFWVVCIFMAYKFRNMALNIYDSL